MLLQADAAPLSETPVLIMAGGRGDRLFPLTLSRPKPLLPIGPFRIIDFVLQNCRNSGLGRVALLTQYGCDQLAAYIRQVWNDGFECVPPAADKLYRGTADAVYQNLQNLTSTYTRNVLILSGDQVYSMDYRSLLRRHVETNADLTIATVRFPLSQASSFGVVEVNGNFRVTGFHEKPTALRSLSRKNGTVLISMGVYVFRTQVLAKALQATCGAGAGYDFGYHVLPSLIDSARIYAYDFRDEVLGAPNYWRDIGTLDTYYGTNMDLARPSPVLSLQALGFAGRVSTTPSVAGLSGSARVWRTMLSGGVRVEDGAEVEDSVLMPGVRVGSGAKIRQAIIDEGVEIPAGFTVGWDPDKDRELHMISRGGVTVVSDTPEINRPRALRERREITSMVSRRRERSGAVSSENEKERS